MRMANDILLEEHFMAKYDPLAQYLQTQTVSDLTLSFGEIEKIIGAVLPRSARERPEWWWNDLARDSSHVQARSWVRGGYLTSRLDLTEQRVSFCRIPESRQAERRRLNTY
jgi:hypothetical protein